MLTRGSFVSSIFSSVVGGFVGGRAPGASNAVSGGAGQTMVSRVGHSGWQAGDPSMRGCLTVLGVATGDHIVGLSRIEVYAKPVKREAVQSKVN